MYLIEENIPAPDRYISGCRKYPWDKMEVGQSILFPAGEEAERARVACKMWARNHRKVFRTRSLAEGVRIWRVA